MGTPAAMALTVYGLTAPSSPAASSGARYSRAIGQRDRQPSQAHLARQAAQGSMGGRRQRFYTAGCEESWPREDHLGSGMA